MGRVVELTAGSNPLANADRKRGSAVTARFQAGAVIAIAVAAFVIHAPAASAQQGGPPPQSRGPSLGPDMMHPQSQSQAYPSAPAEIQQIAGQILDIRQVPIRGVKASNTLVLIGTPQGNKAAVDLGDRLQNLDLRPGQLLEARGRVVEIENRRTILLADAVRYGGLTYDVNRVAFLRRTEPAPAVAGAKPSTAAPAAEAAAAKPADGKPAGAASSASTATPTEAKPAGGANASSAGTTATSTGSAAGAGKADTGGAAAGSTSTGDGAAKPGR